MQAEHEDIKTSFSFEDDSSFNADFIQGKSRYVFLLIALALAIFQIYTATFGLLPSTQHRAVHLALTSAIIFLISPTVKGILKWYDWVLSALALLSAGYVAWNADYIANRFSYVTPLTWLELALGIIGVVLLLEAARRMMGWLLPGVALVFIAYIFIGPYLPRAISHAGFDLMWTIDHLYYTPSGIFGVPLGVSSTYVAIFVIFGSVLAVTGGGKFLTDSAMALMGHIRGGPAKVAVVASALVGMIMGSGSANVVTTGSVTIPLMRRMGYEKDFAAAVEAAASTGGEIAPPIMGAAAFILAQMANIPYSTVAKSAIIPAVLFFLGVYVAVDLESLRLKLTGLPREKLPKIGAVIKEGVLFALPLLIVFYMIFVGYTPIKAGVYAFFATLAVCYLRKSTRLPFKKLVDSLIQSSCNLAPVAVSCGIAGIIIGVITLTGIGIKFTDLVIILSKGNLFLALLLSMVVAIILGMGMPPSAAYIIEAVLVAPALVKLGVQPLAAHFFIFYYTVMSAITPPVAVSAFAAAAISGSNPIKVGWIAVRLGIPGLIVPFVCVYAPEIMLQSEFHFSAVFTIITAILGVVALAIGGAGFLKTYLGWPIRVVFLAAACLLIVPVVWVSIAGLALFAAGLFYELAHKPQQKELQPKSA